LESFEQGGLRDWVIGWFYRTRGVRTRIGVMGKVWRWLNGEMWDEDWVYDGLGEGEEEEGMIRLDEVGEANLEEVLAARHKQLPWCQLLCFSPVNHWPFSHCQYRITDPGPSLQLCNLIRPLPLRPEIY